MSFADSDLLPLSALQHYVYCPRQCALIHVEQQWSENRFTAEGRAQHDRVDRPEAETRDGVRTEYAVPLRSLRLGLIGKADSIEFHGIQSNFKSEISNLKSPVRVFPVEHKRGKPKPDHCDWVQLCAQALCLEEMMQIGIPEGAIFYGQPRRRQPVVFTPELRAETEAVAQKLHELILNGKTPPPEYDAKKCSACSLFDICMPQKQQAVFDYINRMIHEPDPR
ncbi:MAG: CRISPR-associated protein Cas4 [Pontiellaceae bacterium]|jgi:CRISPR-associated exonuclease Cas4|nr:CRISPR-associated protein Cas4 [Pontiellaceae bacterium]